MNLLSFPPSSLSSLVFISFFTSAFGVTHFASFSCQWKFILVWRPASTLAWSTTSRSISGLRSTIGFRMWYRYFFLSSHLLTSLFVDRASCSFTWWGPLNWRNKELTLKSERIVWLLGCHGITPNQMVSSLPRLRLPENGDQARSLLHQSNVWPFHSLNHPLTLLSSVVS